MPDFYLPEKNKTKKTITGNSKNMEQGKRGKTKSVIYLKFILLSKFSFFLSKEHYTS